VSAVAVGLEQRGDVLLGVRPRQRQDHGLVWVGEEPQDLQRKNRGGSSVLCFLCSWTDQTALFCSSVLFSSAEKNYLISGADRNDTCDQMVGNGFLRLSGLTSARRSAPSSLST
jgi:hypothetical protein